MSAYAGIDVSKATLQVALYPEVSELCVTNDAAGLEAITRYLKDHAVERVLVEATGGYERLSVRLLAKAGLITLKPGVGYKATEEDIIANPKKIKIL